MVARSITSKHSAERFQICSFYCNHTHLVEISAVVEFSAERHVNIITQDVSTIQILLYSFCEAAANISERA